MTSTEDNVAEKRDAPGQAERRAVDAFVGGRLRQRRIALGLSQEKLAAAVGITFQQVQKYEKGANRIGASRLYQFARALDVAPSYFFDGLSGRAAHPAAGAGPDLPGGGPGALAGENAGGVARLSPAQSREAIELVRAFNRIADGTVRRRIAALVKVLATKSD